MTQPIPAMSTFQRPPSPTSSVSSTDSLPQNRIHIKRHQIAVGGRQYQSASEALLAYIRQFDPAGGEEDQQVKDTKDTPTKLLTSTAKPRRPSTNDVTGLLSGQAPPLTSKPPPAMPCHSLTTARSMAASGLVVGANGLRVAGTKEDVEDLLTSKVSPKLQAEVTDTLKEIKLRHLLKQAALKSQKQSKTGLQQEVEAALTRSAQLLERVTRENMAAARKGVESSSDISSSDIPTEILLSDTSMSLNDSEAEAEEKPSKPMSPHRFRPSNNSSHMSQSPRAPVSYRPHQPRVRARRPSADSLLLSSQATTSQMKRSSSSSSASLSNQSDPTDILHRIRSRSVSPGQRRTNAVGSAPAWVDQLDYSVKKSVPSWVGELNPSEISESLWTSGDMLEREGNRRRNGAPSWIHDVDKSDISVDNPNFREEMMKSVIKSPSDTDRKVNGFSEANNLSGLTADSQPGLNYSDLLPSIQNTPASTKHVTFTESLREDANSSLRQQHNSPLPRGKTSTPVRPSRSRPGESKIFDSDFNGESFLRNNILPQTARLKKSIDNFMTSSENMRPKNSSSSSSDAGSDSKSLDTMALLSGKPLLRADITGASSIPKDSNMVSKSFSTSPPVSPVNGGSPVMSNSHDSSDGLDGDRPWEQVTSTFKPPVPVDGSHVYNKTRPKDILSVKQSDLTLSGGKQPGSMEALKNMLFKLQAEETSVQENKTRDDVITDQSVPIIPALQGYDFKMEPGGHSLEKALVHLNRLKKLVKTNGNNESQVEEENGHGEQVS